MAVLNEVRLIGNLGKDPEIRETNGKIIARLSVAVPNYGKNGEQKFSDWFDITLFEQQAEYAKEYLRSGDQVLVSGSLKKSEWQDKDTGKTRHTIEINCRQIQGVTLRNKQAQTSSVA